MQPGEKVSYQGHQVCLFPMDYVYCTQVSGPGSFSHCCGHPADWIGPSGNTPPGDPLYAPFDCTLVYSNGVEYGNCRAYSSDAPVWTPMGLTYVTVAFTHDWNPPTATHYSQGDLIYHTGDSGAAYGYHCHIDQSNAYGSTLISYGYYCDPSLPWPCYALSDSQPPEDIFYLTGSETFITDLGQNIPTWPFPPERSKASAIILLAALKKKRRLYGRIKRNTGII